MILAQFLIQACGYHNPHVKAPDLDINPSRIYLPFWSNNTSEMGLESLIMQKTADWLQQSRHLLITADQGRADYILTGTILSVDYPAVAFSTGDVAQTLKARVRTAYRLTDRPSGKNVWEVAEEVREANYPAGTDALRSQSNKKGALVAIADELGEQIYLLITATVTTGPDADE